MLKIFSSIKSFFTEYYDINFTKFLQSKEFTMIIKLIIFFIISFFILKIILYFSKRIIKNKVTGQTQMIITKIISYTGWAVIITTMLNKMGVNLTTLLGAAGIVGIAVGFAAQTSISNLISGLFLISEKPFQIGDVISVDSVSGIVDSIDLLSIKVKTFDNMLVRIPNEQIIKTEVINITKYPVRRMDIKVGVAYKEDIERVRDLLYEIAKKNPYILDNPEPFFLFTDFDSSSCNITFGVYFYMTDYVNTKNSIMIDIKKRFDQENIEIPFPHLSIYTGEATKPFPVEKIDKHN